MQLKLSDKWYTREFGKENTEPMVSVTAGRSDIETPPEDNRIVQIEDALTYKGTLHSASAPVNDSKVERR